jgi:haloalkane dehalogenase
MSEMVNTTISSIDSYPRKKVQVLDSEMAYVEVGQGDPVVFLHGNPTSSYLWRNVIPELEGLGRCLAPDLIGMGDSGKAPNGSYEVLDHARYLDAWFDALNLENVTLVLHDFGSVLGFHWANQNRDRVKAIAYMEGFVRPITFEEWPEDARDYIRNVRTSPWGEEFVLENNGLIEQIIPQATMRTLTEKEMEEYRRPYKEKGEVRRPTLTFPRQVPIGGAPEDVIKIIEDYGTWLSTNDVPKLFINAEPGMLLVGNQREFCRAWLNQQEVTVKGLHYMPEDSPQEIGQAVAQFIKQL